MPRALTSQKIPPLTDTRSLGQRAWLDTAACAALPVDQSDRTFFPSPNAKRGDAIWDDARAICEGCPVRNACLADAMKAEEGAARFGFVGGKSPNERYALGGHATVNPRPLNGPRAKAERQKARSGATKVCTACHVRKSIGDFEPRRAQCKDCRRFGGAQRQAEYRAKHGRPDRVDPAEREKHRARQAKARVAKRAAKAA